ncbi:ATP-binding protein [Butyrivibrio sp. AC2005]|uniref:ATP-binding protein n=1 Tax=Butyrivibrio sp. AC2005 TaxID=1280672 RepID=UPI000427CA49|nr:ATP-binding protein [Butyrivibrio sp. AC2005]
MADYTERIAACCKQLRLSSNLADRAMSQKGKTNQEYLCKLLENEIEYRRKTRIIKLQNSAGFPKRYAPEQFRTDEVDFPDGVSFESLMGLDFHRQGKNIIMYGGTGTGKTMLSILVGIQACKEGIPVRFYRTAGLINLFTESHQNGTLTALKRKLNTAQIIILDEL